MSKKANIINCLMFLTFISLFFILSLVTPARDFSERENRTLQTAPEFSLDSFFSGGYTETYETYITDQFPFRDSWITLKATSELISGKASNNSVYLCENDTLIEAYTAPDVGKLDSNIEAINSLCGNAGVPVYLALIPTASELQRDLLPKGAPNDSEQDTISYVYSNVKAQPVDVYSALESNIDKKLYYRTDHHWTTLGAYYGYEAVMYTMGLEPTPLGSYDERIVTEDFQGTLFSSSGFSWAAPESISVYAQQGDARITNYPDGAAVEGSLYDESYLAKKDKYSYFYGGNTPLLRIETGVSDAGNILILRDSYMDSMSPFMLNDFSEIHIIDLRYYKLSIKKYIDENDIDSVLIAYSVPNFAQDKSMFLMGF